MSAIPYAHLEIGHWIGEQLRAKCTRIELHSRTGIVDTRIRAWALTPANADVYGLACAVLNVVFEASRVPDGARLYTLLSFRGNGRGHRQRRSFAVEPMEARTPAAQPLQSPQQEPAST